MVSTIIWGILMRRGEAGLMGGYPRVVHEAMECRRLFGVCPESLKIQFQFETLWSFGFPREIPAR